MYRVPVRAHIVFGVTRQEEPMADLTVGTPVAVGPADRLTLGVDEARMSATATPSWGVASYSNTSCMADE